MSNKRLSVSEIITHTSRFEHNHDQVEWLKANDCPIVRLILKMWYRPEFKFRVPDTRPPFEPSNSVENHMLLHGKGKQLVMILDHPSNNMEQINVETVFIRLLEQVNRDDAELLVQMITKEPLPYLSKDVIQEAYPEIFL